MQLIFRHDRNLSNFLFHHTDNVITALTFDYSEAWAMHGQLQAPPPPAPDCHTLKVIELLRQWEGLHTQDIGEIIHLLQNMKTSTLDQIAEDIPDEWLPEGGRDAILQWWSAPATATRYALVSDRDYQAVQAQINLLSRHADHVLIRDSESDMRFYANMVSQATNVPDLVYGE